MLYVNVLVLRLYVRLSLFIWKCSCLRVIVCRRVLGLCRVSVRVLCVLRTLRVQVPRVGRRVCLVLG